VITQTVSQQSGVSWQEEVERLFHTHYKFMYCAAKAVLGSSADAEDVIQNLLLKFLQRELRPELRANPKGYLYRAAVHESLNMLRSRRRRQESDEPDGFDILDAASDRANNNARDRLRHIFSELKPQYLEIVILHYEHGFSDADIGELLGKSRSTIASILSRVRARLNKALV